MFYKYNRIKKQNILTFSSLYQSINLYRAQNFIIGYHSLRTPVSRIPYIKWLQTRFLTIYPISPCDIQLPAPICSTAAFTKKAKSYRWCSLHRHQSARGLGVQCHRVRRHQSASRMKARSHESASAAKGTT